MESEITIEHNLNSCNQVMGTCVLVVPTVATGISVLKNEENLSYGGTTIINRIGKTTGIIFQINLVGNCIAKSAFSPDGYLESILNFLDIVNNKDGWSFLQQASV